MKKYFCHCFFSLLLSAASFLTISHHKTSVQTDNFPSPSTSQRTILTAALSIKESSCYELSRSFIGYVQAGKKSQVGFEQGGLLQDIFFNEGEHFSQGEVLAILDTSKLQALRQEMEHQLDQAQAQRDLAIITHKRIKELTFQQVSSPQALDENQQNLRIQEATVRLKKSQIATIDLSIKKSKLIAPFSGVITQRYLDEGTVVRVGQAVFEIQDLILEVRVGVPQTHAKKYIEDSSANLRINEKDVPAKIKAILPVRKMSTRTVDFIFELPYSADIKTGDIAIWQQVQIISEKGFWLPIGSLTEGIRGLWACYLLEEISPSNENNKKSKKNKKKLYQVTPCQLEVLHQEKERVYVQGSIQNQDLIVAEGVFRVVPGQIVSLKHILFSSVK